jgi:hypothetical protein
LHGNARANKHRGAAQDVRVRANDGRFLHGAVPFKRRKHISLQLPPP